MLTRIVGANVDRDEAIHGMKEPVLIVAHGVARQDAGVAQSCELFQFISTLV